MRINIKPLSANEAFRGRKFRTAKYDKYISDLMILLPKIWLPQPPYSISMVVGYSNVLSDIDNVIKPFIDCLQKKYDFNDRHIFRIEIEKQIVKKGAEFIDFDITPFLHNKTNSDILSDKF